MALLEILGVLVILGILSSVLISAIPAAPEKNISQNIYQFDQALREAARKNGSIRCEVKNMRLEADIGQQRRSMSLPVGTRFTNARGQVLRSWNYDRYGCSIDYTIVWPSGSAFIAGLSGTLHEKAPAWSDE